MATRNDAASIPGSTRIDRSSDDDVRKRLGDIDPRIVSSIRGQPLHIQFLVLGVTMALGPSGSKQLLNYLAPDAMGDINETIPETGKPLHHYLGKTREQIEREVDGDEEKTDAIVTALNDSGRKLPGEDDDDGGVTEQAATATTAATSENVSQPGGPGTKPMVQNTGMENREPVFGTDQIPVSELIPLSDVELRQVAGIDDAQFNRIREIGQQRAQGAQA